MTKVTIIGTTSWGITLGHIMATKGFRVHIWARSESEAFEHNHEAGHHESISFTSSPPEAVEDANMIIWAVPAQSIRQNVRMFRDWLDPTTILVNAAKGVEVGTGKRMSEVIQDEIEPALWKKACVLSGPNLAREIYQGLPAAAIVASRETRTTLSAQELLNAPNFRVFTSSDITGVELAGALKNVIALGAGIIDGLELGDNAKGAFICIGWAEMAAIGATLGADPATFYGLAGLGDLFATCASPLSRNHTAGYDLGRGKTLSDILAGTPHVAEGVDTTLGLINMAERLKIDMPITLLIHRVLFGGLAPAEAVLEFKKLIAKQPAAAVTSPQRYL